VIVNENSPPIYLMKKQNKNSFTILGINGAIAVLNSEQFHIVHIDIITSGPAEKNESLMDAVFSSNMRPRFYEKSGFFQKYPEGRTQGIAVTFSGQVLTQDLPDFSDKNNACLLALDQIEDPQNFGQIIRTAECAGIDAIIFPRHHSANISDTVLQVSQGAFINMPLIEVTNLKNTFSELKEDGFWIVGLENSIDAKPWHTIDYKDKTVIVVGSEGKGIREKVLESCDFKATIPMQGITNSLNVSAAVSAIIFERLRQIEETH
jgi:23S rRNA (guanosine2251-2'-O)-methyltransferase